MPCCLACRCGPTVKGKDLVIPVASRSTAGHVLHLCLLLRSADGAVTVQVAPASASGAASGAGSGLAVTALTVGTRVELEAPLGAGVK
jgi:hypothetical protein